MTIGVNPILQVPYTQGLHLPQVRVKLKMMLVFHAFLLFKSLNLKAQMLKAF